MAHNLFFPDDENYPEDYFALNHEDREAAFLKLQTARKLNSSSSAPLILKGDKGDRNLRRSAL